VNFTSGIIVFGILGPCGGGLTALGLYFLISKGFKVDLMARIILGVSSIVLAYRMYQLHFLPNLRASKISEDETRSEMD